MKQAFIKSYIPFPLYFGWVEAEVAVALPPDEEDDQLLEVCLALHLVEVVAQDHLSFLGILMD